MAPKGCSESLVPTPWSAFAHFSVRPLLKQILTITEKQVNKNTTNLTVNKRGLFKH